MERKENSTCCLFLFRLVLFLLAFSVVGGWHLNRWEMLNFTSTKNAWRNQKQEREKGYRVRDCVVSKMGKKEEAQQKNASIYVLFPCLFYYYYVYIFPLFYVRPQRTIKNPPENKKNSNKIKKRKTTGVLLLLLLCVRWQPTGNIITAAFHFRQDFPNVSIRSCFNQSNNQRGFNSFKIKTRNTKTIDWPSRWYTQVKEKQAAQNTHTMSHMYTYREFVLRKKPSDMCQVLTRNGQSPFSYYKVWRVFLPWLQVRIKQWPLKTFQSPCVTAVRLFQQSTCNSRD